MKKIRLLFLMIIFSFCFSSTLSKETFKVSTITNDKTEIVFSIPDVEVINNQGQIEFKPNDLIGMTSEEGFPQLPIYSSLFEMVPGVSYDIEYEILSSYFIDDIDMKTNEGYSFYPIDNLSLSEPMVMR